MSTTNWANGLKRPLGAPRPIDRPTQISASQDREGDGQETQGGAIRRDQAGARAWNRFDSRSREEAGLASATNHVGVLARHTPSQQFRDASKAGALTN